MTCYVLDTDHLSLYERAHPEVCRRILQARQQSKRLTTSVITVEEQVPVISCGNCGGSYLTAETLKQIDQIKQDRSTHSVQRPVAVTSLA